MLRTDQVWDKQICFHPITFAIEAVFAGSFEAAGLKTISLCPKCTYLFKDASENGVKSSEGMMAQ